MSFPGFLRVFSIKPEKPPFVGAEFLEISELLQRRPSVPIASVNTQRSAGLGGLGGSQSRVVPLLVDWLTDLNPVFVKTQCVILFE